MKTQNKKKQKTPQLKYNQAKIGSDLGEILLLNKKKVI